MRAPYSKEKIKKRKIIDKKGLMREMYACKDCDCESYPWCTKLGGLCRECIDLQNYVHKKPLRSKPGRYDTDKSEINNIAHTTLNYPFIKVIPTTLDGDCLYTAISIAFDKKITVKDLRHLVARYQTESTYNTYKELSSFMSEYRPIQPTKSLRDFRILIKKTGKDVGIGNCVWGDENTLQILSTSLRLGIIIFNEKGQYIQHIIPERTSTFNNTQPSRYILLLLNSGKSGNEHYNLLEFNRHVLLTEFEWKKMKNILSSQQTTR